jgi:3-oxoacyl-[acyl-carrier protein] reductase
MDGKPLAGRVAIVTGGSRGIGLAVASLLAEDGAAVVVSGRDADRLARASNEIEALGGTVLGVVADAASRADVDRLVDTAKERFSRIDILVNNAGMTRDGLLLRMKDADWDEVLETNLRAVFRLSRAVMRGMIKARWGRIINITSVVGAAGNAGQANYAAAKAGVVGMTKSLARELGSRSITVNCVAPGFIDTDMTRALTEAQRSALLAQIPLGRLGEAADVAAAVAYLASPAASYVTGCVLHVNGGMYMA